MVVTRRINLIKSIGESSAKINKMAEGNAQEEGLGNWWDGWLQSAKEKSTAALELVKKDLSEFTCTVRTDTSNAVAATSGTLQQTINTEKREPAMAMVKSGISSFLDGITRVLTIPPDDGPVDELTIQQNGEATYDRGRARLTAIQLDPGTYCSEPSGRPEQYEMWRENFDLESKKGDISEMLVSRVEVRALYTKLVPSEVSHADFWARYFYKVHQLELDEARKVALMKRAEQTREESFTWDDDDGSDTEDKDHPDGKEVVTGALSDNQPDRDSTKHQHSSNKQPSATLTVTDLSETFVKPDIQSDSSRLGQLHIDQTVSHTDQAVVQNEQTVAGTTEAVPDVSESANMRANLLTDQNSQSTKHTDCPTKPKLTESENQDVHRDTSGESTQGTISKEPSPSNCKETDRIIPSEKSDDVVQPVVVSEPEGKADCKVLTEIKMREKGDMVVVGSGSSSPISDSSANVKKDRASGEGTDEDWDEDFDIELTEEDIRLAEEAAKKYKSPETLEDLDIMEDDWNWD